MTLKKNQSQANLKLYIALFVSSQIIVVGIVVFARSRQQVVATCSSVVATKTIAVTASGFEPANSTVKVCTKVVFVNQDSHDHLPAFGEHDHHDDPVGFAEKLLAQNATNSFTLRTTGTLGFHDHLDDDFTGSLTVTP